jgi:hypothetical protein
MEGIFKKKKKGGGLKATWEDPNGSHGPTLLDFVALV